MSDTFAPPTQKTIGYMVRLLQMNPVQECEEIVSARSGEFGEAKKSDRVGPSAASQAKNDRQNLLARLDELRKEFWTLPPEKLEARLAQLDTHGYADVDAAAARLRVVAAHREEFPKLAAKLGFDRYIVDSLKDILTKSAREVVALKEHELETISNGAHRKRGRRFVKLVKREMPAIYKLEADWFDAVYRQKAQGKRFVASSRPGIAPAVGGLGSSRGKWWFIWIAIVVVGRIVASLPSETRNNTIPPRMPSHWESPSVPIPQSMPHSTQTYGKKADDPHDSLKFGNDKRIWEAYPAPGTPESSGQKGTQPPKNLDEIVFPQNTIQFGPGSSQDGRYSR